MPNDGERKAGQQQVLDRIKRILVDVDEHGYTPEDVVRELRVMVRRGLVVKEKS